MGAGGAAGEEELEEEETAPGGRGYEAPSPRLGLAQPGPERARSCPGPARSLERSIQCPGLPVGERGAPVPLCGPRGSWSDLQPAAPREAWLACRAPSTLRRRAAALNSRPALLGVRWAGGGARQRGGSGAERVERLRAALRLTRAESNRRGRREKASPEGEASRDTAKGTLLPPPGSADHLLGSPRGSLDIASLWLGFPPISLPLAH